MEEYNVHPFVHTHTSLKAGGRSTSGIHSPFERCLHAPHASNYWEMESRSSVDSGLFIWDANQRIEWAARFRRFSREAMLRRMPQRTQEAKETPPTGPRWCPSSATVLIRQGIVPRSLFRRRLKLSSVYLHPVHIRPLPLQAVKASFCKLSLKHYIAVFDLGIEINPYPTVFSNIAA